MPWLLVSFAAVAALVYFLKGKVMSGTVRGVANNNWGNLEDNGIDWEGLAEPRNDGRFLRFEKPEYGTRALAKVLYNYQRLHGIDNISDIVKRYAPGHENPTDNYIQFVSHHSAIPSHQPINIQRNLFAIMDAIIIFETGQKQDESIIKLGIELAGLN